MAIARTTAQAPAYAGSPGRGFSRVLLSRMAIGLAFATIVTAAAPARRAQQPAPHLERATTLLVVAQNPNDPRILQVQQAVVFWQQTFADLGLEQRLAGVRVHQEETPKGAPWARTLENYAHELSQAAGRLTPGASGPPTPAALEALPSDLIVLLSETELMPFAWPLDEPTEGSPSSTADAGQPAARRFFVAIPKHAAPRTAASLRNVIAHEIGHTLGLKHSSDAQVLMCMPCPQIDGEAEQPDFLPLSDADRERLVRKHRRHP